MLTKMLSVKVVHLLPSILVGLSYKWLEEIWVYDISELIYAWYFYYVSAGRV